MQLCYAIPPTLLGFGFLPAISPLVLLSLLLIVEFKQTLIESSPVSWINVIASTKKKKLTKWGEEGESKMYGESNMETYIPYVK